MTPFPDQDIIRNDMARAAYRSKLDMSKVYEQICIVPEHVHKTVFATVLGTFRSQVMQMGDCNAPSMFQQLMTAIFWDCISRFMLSSRDPRPIAEIPSNPRSIPYRSSNSVPTILQYSNTMLTKTPNSEYPPNPLTHFLSLSELRTTSKQPQSHFCLHL